MNTFKFFALTIPEEDMSFFEKAWSLFREMFIDSPDYYENLTVDSGTLLSVRLIILGIFIGMILATFAMAFNKQVLGDVVRKLLSKEALSPETALTLEELGYKKSFVIRLALKRSTSLKRVVKSREEEKYYEELENKREEYLLKKKNGEKIPKFKEIPYKMDVTADRFYIPEKLKYMADVKFEKKGNSWIGAIVIALVLIVAFFVVMYFLPYILDLVNDVVGGFKSSGNNKIL